LNYIIEIEMQNVRKSKNAARAPDERPTMPRIRVNGSEMSSTKESII
jgi:hypothetical protein